MFCETPAGAFGVPKAAAFSWALLFCSLPRPVAWHFLSVRPRKTAREETLEGLSVTAQISVDRQQLMDQASPPEEGEAPDRDAMQEALQGAQELSLEEMEKYAEADSVKDFTYSITASLDSDDEDALAAVDTSFSSQSSDQEDSGSQENVPDDVPQGGGQWPGGERQGAPGMGT